MMVRHDCDICIIGSGFGGSVCALRSAEAGLRVVLLERGPRISIADYEDMAARKRAFVRRRSEPNGIAEVHALRGMGALTASAVGGGSHLYTAVTVPAPPEVFTREWCHLTRGSLDPYYARAQNIIAPSITPILLERTAALEKVSGQIGGSKVRLPVAIDWPLEKTEMAHAPSFEGLRRETAVWLQGGHACRKRTLDRTYLALAELRGAEVRPLHEVTAVAPISGGYEVTFCSSQHGRTANGSLRARRVVVAAGALGTLKLLFRCRDQLRCLPLISSALGERFFMNGDLGALIFGMREGPSPDCGPPVTGWIDLWQSDRMFLMELATWPTGLGLSTLSPRWGRAWCFGVMGYDDRPSKIEQSRSRKLMLRRDISSDTNFDRRRIAKLSELAKALGGRLLVVPQWLERRMPTTVHPMGGAVIADSPQRGVANPFGEVYGYPGLYVSDASLFPTPTGVAPSMTIAAMAEHVIENLLKNSPQSEAGAL